MSLARFSIICTTDIANGIAKEGELPFDCKSCVTFFKKTTVGNNRNAVIMGRITYETFGDALPDRHNVVVSRTLRQEDHHDITVCSSFYEALSVLGGGSKKYDEIFVIGGESLFNEAVHNYLYLCNRVYVSRLKNSYNCDQFFPFDDVKEFNTFQETQKTKELTRYFLKPNIIHQEYTYLSLLSKVIEEGEVKNDVDGISIKSLYGGQLSFDISDRIPILTTRKLVYDDIIKQLLFFISGETKLALLDEVSKTASSEFKLKTTREKLDARKLEYDEHDLGAWEGYQLRKWNKIYNPPLVESDVESGNSVLENTAHLDQLEKVITSLRNEPHSQQHLLVLYNPMQHNLASFDPKVIALQFNVSGDRKFLDCHVMTRVTNVFSDMPHLIAFYSMLTYMIGHITNMRPRKLVCTASDLFISENQISQARKISTRTPHPFPTLKFRRPAKIHEISDYVFDNFIIENYNSWAHIG